MGTIDQGLVGRTLVGLDGQKIGRIDGIYVNSATGEAEWVAINLGGLLATKHGFAPVTKVSSEGDHAVVHYDKHHVKHAPTTKSEGGALSPAENEALYRYYGIDHGAEVSGSRDAALDVSR
jgi:uncharacterized protein YrrD